MHCVKVPNKKAVAGGRTAGRNGLQTIRYHFRQSSSNGFSPQTRKIRLRPGNRFEDRRKAVIAGLLAASTPAERLAIERGQREGRKLRRELEAMSP